MLLVVVLLLLSVFAIIFRRNVSLFGKMMSEIVYKKHKNSIFDTADKENFLFNIFMSFQTLTLLSISVFSLAMKYGYIESLDLKTTLLCTVGLIFIFFIFYIFKKIIFNTLLYIFAESGEQKVLSVSHRSFFQLWGIFLYLPVFWILLVGDGIIFVTFLLIISYIFIKIILACRFIYTFFGKNIWLLFLNLYLCSLEIIPLMFLYEGLIYIYNIINK
jgi:hypothetical protein